MLGTVAVAAKGHAGFTVAKVTGAKAPTPGANDQTVLASLQGLTEPLDIKAVAGKTGLSHHRASYTLKKLAGEGLLTQSSVAGGRGMPKLVFALASNPETMAAAEPKRKARKKARRRSKAPASAMAN
jgi:predicted ArsR family transcriptional regulator